MVALPTPTLFLTFGALPGDNVSSPAHIIRSLNALGRRINAVRVALGGLQLRVTAGFYPVRTPARYNQLIAAGQTFTPDHLYSRTQNLPAWRGRPVSPEDLGNSVREILEIDPEEYKGNGRANDFRSQWHDFLHQEVFENNDAAAMGLGLRINFPPSAELSSSAPKAFSKLFRSRGAAAAAADLLGVAGAGAGAGLVLGAGGSTISKVRALGRQADTLSKRLKSSRSVVCVETHDDHCLYFAYILWRAHFYKDQNKAQFNRIYKHSKAQRDRARELDTERLIEEHKLPTPCPLSALPEVQEKLKVRFVLHDVQTLQCLHRGDDFMKYPLCPLLVNLSAEHVYGLITDLNRFAGFSKSSMRLRNFGYCKLCCQWISSSKHDCEHPEACAHCGLQHPNQPDKFRQVLQSCENCFRALPEACFEAHISSGLCKRTWWCASCQNVMLRLTNPPERHKCGHGHCKFCHTQHSYQEYCRLPVLKPTNCTLKVIAFDTETFLSPSSEHIVGCVGAMYHREYSPDQLYYHFDSLDKFLDWLITEEHHDFLVFAHNLSGYDGHLVFRRLCQRGEALDHIIKDGNRLVQFRVKRLKLMFRDSFRQLAMPLSKFVKAFDLPKELSKGYFPYSFYKPETFNYQGDMPELKYYLDDSRDKDGHQEALIRWHVEEKIRRSSEVLCGRRMYEFDMWEELQAYCKQDVKLLMLGLVAYQKQFHLATSRDPLKAPTSSSAAMATFRTVAMPPDSVVVMPRWLQDWARRGYYGGLTTVLKPYYQLTGKRPLSQEHFRYIDVCSMYPDAMFKGSFPIGMPELLKEQKCSEVPLDRWCRRFSKESEGNWLGMYEVSMLPPKRASNSKTKAALFLPVLPTRSEGRLMFTLYPIERQVYTSMEIQYALQCGYRLQAVHQALVWRNHSKTLFRSYIAIFWCLKFVCGGYPAHVKTVRQKTMHLADTLSKLELNFSEGDRSIVSRLKQVLNARYGLLTSAHSEQPQSLTDAYMVYYNLLARLSRDRPRDELFGVWSIELLAQIAVLMDYPSSSMKLVCKLLLNSLYGKFGQRNEYPRTAMCQSQEEVWSYLSSPFTTVTDMQLFHDQYDYPLDNGEEDAALFTRCQVTYKDGERPVQTRQLHAFSHVVIAAMVTARARLKLLRTAHIIGEERCLYMDTDSLIYVNDQPEISVKRPMISTLRFGSFLGEWEDEHPSPDEFLNGAFVSCAPKIYSYTTNTGKCITHIKGFKETVTTRQMFRFNHLKKTLLDKISTRADYQRFQADGIHRIHTVGYKRTLQPCIAKRCVSHIEYSPEGVIVRIDTVPHGHRYCPHKSLSELTQAEIYDPAEAGLQHMEWQREQLADDEEQPGFNELTDQDEDEDRITPIPTRHRVRAADILTWTAHQMGARTPPPVGPVPVASGASNPGSWPPEPPAARLPPSACEGCDDRCVWDPPRPD